MRSLHVSICTVLFSLMLIALFMLAIQLEAENSVLNEIENLMSELEYLHSRGLCVDDVVDLLNKAIEEYSRGNTQSAIAYLEEAKQRVVYLKPVAERVYLEILITRGLTVAILASIPILIYFVLPRVYLYVWFKLHRRWIIR
ncbi:MAG: hypothetical protein QW721_00820 [Desulfurococcaceae archaeon]